MFLSWMMVMGTWGGRVESSGGSGLLRVLCKEEHAGRHEGCWHGELSPSCDPNNDPCPKARTCRRTLAVSSGKVTRSAKQAAVPAPRNFTAVVGGTSEGFSPTMVPEGSAWSLQGPAEVQGERPLCSSEL